MAHTKCGGARVRARYTRPNLPRPSFLPISKDVRENPGFLRGEERADLVNDMTTSQRQVSTHFLFIIDPISPSGIFVISSPSLTRIATPSSRSPCTCCLGNPSVLSILCALPRVAFVPPIGVFSSLFTATSYLPKSLPSLPDVPANAELEVGTFFCGPSVDVKIRPVEECAGPCTP